MNLWYSHYLYGIENGIENLPQVTAQDNLDPSKWRRFDKWDTNNAISARIYSKREDVTVTGDYYGTGNNWTTRNQDAAFHSSEVAASYAAPVDQDVTIKGHIPVHFSAAFVKGDKNHAHVSATLMDVSDEDFDVVKEEITYDKDGYSTRTLDKETIDETGYWNGSNLETLPLKRYKTHKVKSVVIARGWMNLANPASRYDSASSSHSIDLKENEYHDYTMYLQPNLYTVKKGHRLVLSLHTYDPDYIYFADPYEVTFKTDSISATIPIVEDSRSLLFRYQPSEKDTEYASLADRILPIATIQPKVDPEQDPSPVDQAEKPIVPSNPMTPTNPAISEISQKPSHGRDLMDFRKEQKEETAQELAQRANKDKIEVTSQPSLPKTGQATSPWTLFGFLGLVLTSLLSLGKAHKDE